MTLGTSLAQAQGPKFPPKIFDLKKKVGPEQRVSVGQNMIFDRFNEIEDVLVGRLRGSLRSTPDKLKRWWLGRLKERLGFLVGARDAGLIFRRVREGEADSINDSIKSGALKSLKKLQTPRGGGPG